jgi:Putative zinc-finger
MSPNSSKCITVNEHRSRKECREVRRAIYLYRELGDKDRASIDEHLLTCDECRSLYRETEGVRNLVKGALSVNVPENQMEALTSRIMEAVEKKSPRIQILHYLTLFFDHRITRFAFGSFSAILLAVLLYQLGDVQDFPSERGFRNGDGAELNSRHFYQIINGRKNPEKRKIASFVDCIKGCHEQGRCATCMNKISGLMKRYENF